MVWQDIGSAYPLLALHTCQADSPDHAQKEEKVFDESLAQLDQKVQRATANYEKTRPRARPSMADAQSAAANHDRYIQSLSSLSTSISTLKGNYAETAGEKREKVVKEVGRALCGLAEAGWRNRVEGTRKGGEKAGLVVECGVFCESGMSIGPGVGQELEQPTSPVHPQQQAQPDRPSATTNQGALRGPRPQPGSEQSSYFDQPPSQPSLDSSLFAPSPHHPPNTYTVQLDALRPPTPSQPSPSSTHSRTLEAPSQQHHSRPGSVNRLGSTDSLASRHPVQQAQYTSDAPRTRSPLDMAGGGGEEMEPSRSSGTMYSLSSTSSSDARGGIVAPRGFVLNDEPLSPTSRTTVDHGSTGAEEQVADPAELRRPTPRYGGPSPASTPQKETVKATGLERTDTSASERNFVARMREKYAEEKERKQEEQEAERNRVGGGAQERVSTLSPELARLS